MYFICMKSQAFEKYDTTNFPQNILNQVLIIVDTIHKSLSTKLSDSLNKYKTKE